MSSSSFFEAAKRLRSPVNGCDGHCSATSPATAAGRPVSTGRGECLLVRRGKYRGAIRACCDRDGGGLHGREGRRVHAQLHTGDDGSADDRDGQRALEPGPCPGSGSCWRAGCSASWTRGCRGAHGWFGPAAAGYAIPAVSAVLSGAAEDSFETCQVVPNTAVNAIAANTDTRPGRPVVSGATGR